MTQKSNRLPAKLTAAIVLALATGGTACAAAESESTDKRWALDEVVVTGQRASLAAPNTTTATRTPTAVERVPQSIQTLTRTLLEEQELQTISDALVNVSGVTPSRTLETVLQSPLIRGFAVNYTIDGLPTYGVPSTIADPATLINVERIEVAKGPTSTLYGGGVGAPLSGLLNVVSRDTGPDFSTSLGLRSGSFGTLGAEADLNLPTGENAAVRIAAMYEDADSYIDVVDSRRSALYPSFTWALGSDTTLRLRGQYNRLQQREYAGLPAELTVAPELLIARDTYAGAEDVPRTEVENRVATLTLDHRLANDLQLSLALRRVESDYNEFSTFPLLQLAGTLYAFGSGVLPSDVDSNFASLSAYGEFGSDQVRHRLLIGADFDRTDYVGGLGINFEWGIVDFADRSSNLPFGAPPAVSDVQTDTLRTNALFVQDQISIGERLDLTAGLRWTQLDVHSRYTSGGFPFVDYDQSYHELTPRLGATWQLTDGAALFAGHARGFQGVVAAFGVTDPEPETSVSNEIGVKLAEPINGLTGTFAVYQLKRRHVVTSDPDNVGLSIQSGEQRAQGFETDVIYEPTKSLSLLFSYTYTDAEVTRDNRLPVGDRLRRVPQHAGRVAARYRFVEGALRGFSVGLGATAVSARELTLPNTTAVAGQVLWDAQIAYDFERVSLSLSLVNLLDREGFEPYQYLGGAYVLPTQPLSAFVSLRTRF